MSRLFKVDADAKAKAKAVAIARTVNRHAKIVLVERTVPRRVVLAAKGLVPNQ